MSSDEEFCDSTSIGSLSLDDDSSSSDNSIEKPTFEFLTNKDILELMSKYVDEITSVVQVYKIRKNKSVDLYANLTVTVSAVIFYIELLLYYNE